MSTESPSPAPLLFADLGLPDTVMAAVTAVGYESPSPIQAATIPAMAPPPPSPARSQSQRPTRAGLGARSGTRLAASA